MPKPSNRELVAPGHTAFLLQEVQEGILGANSALPELADAAAETDVVKHCAQLAARARSVGVPVVHLTAVNLPGGFGLNQNSRLFAGARKAGALLAPGSPEVAPMAELGVDAGDVILPRYHGLNPMTGSPLDSLLRNEGITTVVVAGVSLNIAIPNMVFDAINRSYQVVVVEDAVAGTPVSYGRSVIEHTLRLVATIATTEQVLQWWASEEPEPGS
ncbi:MAG TPA: cysteine hydrolase [Jatrophihabitans sp.]